MLEVKAAVAGIRRALRRPARRSPSRLRSRSTPRAVCFSNRIEAACVTLERSRDAWGSLLDCPEHMRHRAMLCENSVRPSA